MRMRVALGGDTVRGPARVRDAYLAVRRIRLDGVLQDLHLADRAQALQLGGAVQNRDSRRVVPAVFEPSQPLHQDGDHIALSDGSDDAAHLTVSGKLGGASLPEAPGGTQGENHSFGCIWYPFHIRAHAGAGGIANQYAKTGLRP